LIATPGFCRSFHQLCVPCLLVLEERRDNLRARNWGVCSLWKGSIARTGGNFNQRKAVRWRRRLCLNAEHLRRFPPTIWQELLAFGAGGSGRRAEDLRHWIERNHAVRDVPDGGPNFLLLGPAFRLNDAAELKIPKKGDAALATRVLERPEVLADCDFKRQNGPRDAVIARGGVWLGHQSGPDVSEPIRVGGCGGRKNGAPVVSERLEVWGG